MKVYEELDTVMDVALTEITEFSTIEPYNDQYRNQSTEDAKAYPAAYYELLEPVNWEQGLNNWQVARMRARIHIVVFDVKRDKNKLHLMGQKVFVKMQGAAFNDPTDTYCLTSEWNRVASSIPKRYKQTKVITIDFEFEAFDTSSMDTVNLQAVGITIP